MLTFFCFVFNVLDGEEFDGISRTNSTNSLDPKSNTIVSLMPKSFISCCINRRGGVTTCPDGL